MDSHVVPPAEVSGFYNSTPEESRLESGLGQLEFERTKEILARVLVSPPARIVDVGGAAGVYSLWLAAQGYEVHLVDASPRLVEEARARSARSPQPIATGHADYFTTAYFHRPEDLRAELAAAAFQNVEVLGVEGPGWLLQDFDDRWQDDELRRDMLDVARALEAEPSIIGASAHLLGIGRKP